MNLTDLSIRSPVGVTVGVLLVALFGLLAFFGIPVQLTPNVDKPRLTVETRWRGASPQEVEREIVDEQEEYLKNVEGLLKLTSESQDGLGRVILEFPPGSDTDDGLLRVSNKLEQVPRYPALADKPVITNADPRANAVAWFVLKRLPGNDRDIAGEYDLCDDVIKPALERVPGVAASNIFGGTERQLVVTVDPQALAARGVTIHEVVAALDRDNQDVSAGDFEEGKRRYVVRTAGRFESPEAVADAVIARRGLQTVFVRDVARVALGFRKTDVSVRHCGEPAIAMNIQRATGANVLEVMARAKATAAGLNRDVLAGRGLSLTQVYDETTYIHGAIALVNGNIVVGGILATAVLFLFLRSGRAVLVIATAIPICVVGTFLAMSLLGRNINVISLAGMSFAVGMVVDNAIVVLENVYRHTQMGKDRVRAAREGTAEVWGAVLASTLTTLAVFIPVFFMVDEAGQLFKDIAIAISAGVGLSLVVAVTVIPCMCAKLLADGGAPGSAVAAPDRPWALLRWASVVSAGIAGAVHALCGGTVRRLAVAGGLTAAAIGGTWALLPPAEYLPQGNRNLVIGIVLPPPGYNLTELTSMAQKIERGMSPHFRTYEGKPNPRPEDPVIDNFFFVARGRQVFLGAIAAKEGEIQDLIPLMRRELAGIPGLFPVVQQTSLFSGIGEGRSVELRIAGPDLPALVGLARRVFGMSMQALPGAQLRPLPSLDLGSPEVRVIPDRILAARAGLDAERIGQAVDVLLDGRKVSEYRHEGRKIDLVLEGTAAYASRSQDFESLPLVAGDGRLVTLGSVAKVSVETGPEQINHIERQRTIAIQVIPPAELPLETAMARLDGEVLDPLRREGAIGGLYTIRMAGTADDLQRTGRALAGNFLLAIVITYLLMAALFESFLHPFVILFSVPLAGVGGIAGLRLVDRFLDPQPMDVLTMLGFVILIGTVVNNAILIVHQALHLMAGGDVSPREAIRESVRSRIRPIFMTMLTSVFGMLPLILFPGPGSELYRGLGSVVVGGLTVSTVFTLFVVPTLFSLTLDARAAVARAFGRGGA